MLARPHRDKLNDVVFFMANTFQLIDNLNQNIWGFVYFCVWQSRAKACYYTLYYLAIAWSFGILPVLSRCKSGIKGDRSQVARAPCWQGWPCSETAVFVLVSNRRNSRGCFLICCWRKHLNFITSDLKQLTYHLLYCFASIDNTEEGWKCLGVFQKKNNWPIILNGSSILLFSQ